MGVSAWYSFSSSMQCPFSCAGVHSKQARNAFRSPGVVRYSEHSPCHAPALSILLGPSLVQPEIYVPRGSRCDEGLGLEGLKNALFGRQRNTNEQGRVYAGERS